MLRRGVRRQTEKMNWALRETLKLFAPNATQIAYAPSSSKDWNDTMLLERTRTHSKSTCLLSSICHDSLTNGRCLYAYSTAAHQQRARRQGSPHRPL